MGDEMKITFEKVEVKNGLTINNVKKGYVFEIDDGGSRPVTALKLCDGKFILLKWSSGYDWFVVGDTSWADYPIKILGKVTEISVEE